MADRFIVNTAAAADPVSAVAELAQWNAIGGSRAASGDLAWRRLSPWREAVASLFDAAVHRPLLQGIRRVELNWGTGASCPGRAQTLYLAGWLAARLGWHLPSAAEPGDGEQMDLSWTSPAGGLSMMIRRGAQGDPALVLVAHEPGGGVVTARVGRGGVAQASLQRPGRPPWEGPAPAPLEDLSATLARELEFRRREPVFAEALAMAGDVATLWRSTGGSTAP